MYKLLLVDRKLKQIADLKARFKRILPESDIITAQTTDLLDTVAEEQPNIIFIPVQAENDDDTDLCRRIKEERSTKNIPVVFLTLNGSDTENRINALEAGAESFLPLPFEETELKSIVKVVLRIGERKSKRDNENNQLKDALFESASDFVFLHHFNKESGVGAIARISDRTCERLGYTSSELTQMRPLDLSPQPNQNVSGMSKQLAKAGKLKFEKTLITKDGENIPVEFDARVIKLNEQQMVLSIGHDITELKKAIDERQSYEDRFLELFRSSPNPEFIWSLKDKSFILENVNNAALKVTDGKAGDYFGMTAEEVYPDRKDIVERLEFCLHKRKNIVFETDYGTRGSGPERRIVFTFSYISETLVLMHTEDITEQRTAQKELEENESKLRSLISEMDQGLAVHAPIFDEDGRMINYRFLDFNESFEKQTGLKRSDTIGKTVLEVLPDTENYWLDQLEKVVNKGVIAHFEQFIAELKRNYEVVAYRNRKNQFATIIRDITEKKKQIKEISLHNQRLEALPRILKHEFRNSKELLTYTINQIVSLTESNSGFIFYYSEETKKLSIQAWSKNVKQENESKTEYELEKSGCWAEAVKRRKPFIINDYEKLNDRRTEILTNQINVKRLLTAPVIINGKIKGVAGVVNKESDYNEKDVKQVTLLMDILWKVLEQKPPNKELVAANEKDEEGLKSEFLTNLSHEVRTPMNGILGFVEMLRKTTISDEEKEEYLNIIEDSGNKILDTLNQLAEISRIETNQIKLNYASINLNEQIDALVKKFKTKVVSKGLQIRPEKAFHYDNAFVETDKEKLNIILSNLIENAIEYTKEGTLDLGYKLNGDNLQFFVKGYGVEIEHNLRKIIFERPEQPISSLSELSEGAGLRLPVAKAYVELLGGKIWVESEKEEGSEFIVELPFKKEDKAKEKVTEDQKTPTGKSDDEILKNLTVLVAEDDEVGRIYLKQMLEGKCEKMFYAKNGKEAVNLYQKNQEIDLILMDIKMPVMDGYSATIKVRSIDYNVKIVAQTAYALSGDREKAIAAGCDDYVTKPLSKETLISTIRKLFT